jgi:hypothetical protein
MLSGNILTENATDFLYVYDGDGIGSQVLVDAKASSMAYDASNDWNYLVLTPVGPVTSTGRNMTVRFTSDAYSQFDGLDLTVEIINNDPHTITINKTGSGTVTARVGGSAVSQASFGQTVVLSPTPAAGYVVASVQIGYGGMQHILQPDANGIYSFEMPAHAVTVSVAFMEAAAFHWGEGNDGSAEHPYVISTKAGWDLLVERSNTDSYSDKHFDLATDISDVSTAIATDPDYPFCGHIDGKGHKVTLALETTNLLRTPAMIMWAGAGCSVENLTVDGTITMNDGMYGAGFISQAKGAVALTNCRSNVTINYTPNYSTPHNGGFIGKLGSGVSATLTRCLFDGAFISSTAATFGGMVGEGGNVSIRNSVVVTGGTTSLSATVNNDNYAFAFVTVSSQTAGWSNNFYVYDTGTNHLNGTINRYNGNIQPQAWQITLTDGATATHSGTGTVIGNGTTTIYADGFSYGGNEYYTQGTSVALGGTPADGMTCVGYTSSDVSIGEGGTFTMPNKTVTVTAHYARTDYVNHWQAGLTRDGSTEAKAYLITTPDGLNLLSSEVNGGNVFNGKFFKLDADISFSHATAWNDNSSTESNFISIGYIANGYYADFEGTFDGQNHIVSGIRIYMAGTYQGLFSHVEDGTVKNVTLADTRITCLSYSGGIVGKNQNGTVDNCHVTATVVIQASNTSADYLGGIAGLNNGIVSNCTSAAIIRAAPGGTGCRYYGGIVGENKVNRTVSNCTAAGVVITIANIADSGAIVGYNDVVNHNSGILDGNTYHSCLVGANAFNIGVGFNGTYWAGEHGDREGASLDNQKLFLFSNRDNSALITAYWFPPSHTANNGTAPSVGGASVTLQGCTLRKNGTWNTLCLPFGVSNFSGTPLDGASVYELSAAGTSLDTSTGALTLSFSAVTSIEAWKPYIVKWSGTDGQVDCPTFSKAVINNTTQAEVTSQDGRAKFIGRAAPLVIDDENRNSILFVDSGNKVGYSQADRTLPAFGAHFWVQPDGTAQGAGTITVDFGDGTGSRHLTGHLKDGFYWATYYNENVSFTLPQGAQAFTMGTDYKLYRLGDDGRTIPAGEAVVIISDVADIELVSTGDGSGIAVHGPESKNILHGSDSAVVLTEGKVTVDNAQKTPYVLGDANSVFGFHRYTGAFLPAHRAWYVK